VKGHIRERSPGHFAIVLDTRDPATGSRRRRWHSFTGTKREAQIECARLISEMSTGTYLEPAKMTLAQFLEQWLANIKANVSPRSHERYEEIAKKNLTPLLGAIHLRKLKPIQISAAYTKALANGRRDGKGGLSPRTVYHMHRLLKQALAQAVRWQLLIRNPVDAVDPPKVERHPMTTYDMAQTAAAIEAMRGTVMFIPALLGLLCGMRRGEISALKWRNVDFTTGQISVVASVEQMNGGIRLKETKNGRARTIAMSVTVRDELRTHRLRKAEDMLKLGRRLTDDDFVAALADGSLMQPTFITHEWVDLISATSLPRVRFHDLRHAHATHMLSLGIHPKVASERLGHSRVGTTLDLYSHVLPGMQEDAAAKLDAALKAARNGT
jgi:integrase